MNPQDQLRKIYEKKRSELQNALPPEYAEVAMATLRFRETLDAESDRGCALMSASYLDDQLTPLVKSKLINDEKISKSLFKGNGLLNTFSTKIDMAYMLGLIPLSIKNNLDTIRKIRNKFAHSPNLLDFSDEEITGLCKNLTIHGRQSTSAPLKIFKSTTLGVLAVIQINRIKALRLETPEEIDIKDYFKTREEILAQYENE